MYLWIQSIEKGILFITRFLEMTWRRLPRETHESRKNGLSIKNRTQMLPDIGRFEVMNECKFGISLFRGLFCFLCAFNKYVINTTSVLCFLQRNLCIYFLLISVYVYLKIYVLAKFLHSQNSSIYMFHCPYLEKFRVFFSIYLFVFKN